MFVCPIEHLASFLGRLDRLSEQRASRKSLVTGHVMLPSVVAAPGIKRQGMDSQPVPTSVFLGSPSATSSSRTVSQGLVSNLVHASVNCIKRLALLAFALLLLLSQTIAGPTYPSEFLCLKFCPGVCEEEDKDYTCLPVSGSSEWECVCF